LLVSAEASGARQSVYVRDKECVEMTMSDGFEIVVTVNGDRLERRVEPRLLLSPSLYGAVRRWVGDHLDDSVPGVLFSYLWWYRRTRAFVEAGGLLLAGPDPTGYGGVLPGFGDQRELELLVEAGFTPVEAIKIATFNGAKYLGELDRLGTLEVGKLADMALIEGDPSQRISDIRNVRTVFKEGIGYDSASLIAAVRGTVGVR